MREVLYEETINPSNYDLRKTVSIILGVIKALCIVASIAFILLALLLFDLHYIFSAVLFALFAVIDWIFQRNILYCVDCAFVSGSTRLTKVLGYKSRKEIIDFEHDEVLMVGKMGSNSFEKLYLDRSIKRVFATPNKFADGSFYVLIQQKGEKILVILDCKEDYLKNLVAYSGRQVIEKDYK